MVVEQERRRQAARAAWSRYFAQADVFLCPTNFAAAFPHDPRPFDERTIATPDVVRGCKLWLDHGGVTVVRGATGAAQR